MIATLVAICSFTAQAQEQGDIRATVSLAYGTEAEEVGLNIGGEYLITDKISGGASYTTFFVPDGLSFTSINIDGRYYFASAGAQVYGLAGIGIVEIGVDLGPFGSATINETGVNLGLGAHIPLSGKLGALGQVKYNTAFDGQLVLQGGVAFTF